MEKLIGKTQTELLLFWKTNKNTICGRDPRRMSSTYMVSNDYFLVPSDVLVIQLGEHGAGREPMNLSSMNTAD